jgi:hypothetical protein
LPWMEGAPPSEAYCSSSPVDPAYQRGRRGRSHER